MTIAIEHVEVRIPTPILQTINQSLAVLFRRTIAQLEQEVNHAIEHGVKLDEAAREAEIIVQDARKAIKVINEVRLQYTRPIDEAKKCLIAEIDALLRPLTDSTRVLDDLLIERATEIRRKQDEARRVAEQKRLELEAEARREEERRRKISIAKGGDGTFTPVQIEKPIVPVEQMGMRSVTRTKSIVDKDRIQAAIDNGIREIPGVRIYQIWTFEITDAAVVPDDYRKFIRG